jgi:hypothetical protein
MSLNAMRLTSRDMARARVMLRDQSKGEDPYELLDDEGDLENRDKRRVLIIWCLRSREDPDFTWDMAWDVPFSEVYADDDEPEEGAEGDGVDPLAVVAPSSSPNDAAAPKTRPPGDAPARSSATSTPSPPTSTTT